MPICHSQGKARLVTGDGDQPYHTGAPCRGKVFTDCEDAEASGKYEFKKLYTTSDSMMPRH